MNQYNVGLVLSADYLPVHQLLKLSPMIDQLGYTQVSVPEIWGHDGISLLAALSQTTKHAKLSTGIANIYSRTPGLMAMTATSLNEMSNGRFVLGLGLSGPRVIEGFHGMRFKKPLQRTREYVDVLRTLFAGKRLNHETKQLGTLRGFKLSIETSHIPIHIASLGPKNIELTAEIADGWIPVIMPVNEFKNQVDTVQQHLEKYKRDKELFDITPFILSIAGDDPLSMGLLRGHLSYYYAGMGDFYNNMLRRIGYEDEAIELKDLWKKGKIKEAAAAVSDELLAGTCVFGTKDEMQEKMMGFIKAGATTPLVSLPFKSNFDQAMATYQALAPAGVQ